jgi:formyl-CoA transferase
MLADMVEPHPVAGAQKVLGNPIKVAGPQEFRPSPLLGEHTDEVLASVGCLSEAEIAALREAGIV